MPAKVDTPEVKAQQSEDDGWEPGRSLEEEEQREALRKREAVRAAELENERRKNAELNTRLLRLEEAIQENMRYVRKLHEQGLVEQEIAAAATEEGREKARRQMYERLRRENDGHVVIQLHTDPNEARNAPVPVVINGRRWELKRGEPLTVSVDVLEVLDHARVAGHQKVIDKDGNPRLERYDYLVYPYSIISGGVAGNAPLVQPRQVA